MELDNTEKRNRPFSAGRQKRIRRKSPGLTFPADLFWPRRWPIPFAINAQNFILSYLLKKD
ncbi:hypothetical protein CYJ36_15460 [Bacillus sp. UMB0893]|nr:hypothetical protein CYJ36_15460 [Bacillus sp. UMB0893]